MADGSRHEPIAEPPLEAEIIELARELARGLARQHHEAEQRRESEEP
jgi:hypothetical protein